MEENYKTKDGKGVIVRIRNGVIRTLEKGKFFGIINTMSFIDYDINNPNGVNPNEKGKPYLFGSEGYFGLKLALKSLEEVSL